MSQQPCLALAVAVTHVSRKRKSREERGARVWSQDHLIYRVYRKQSEKPVNVVSSHYLRFIFPVQVENVKDMEGKLCNNFLVIELQSNSKDPHLFFFFSGALLIYLCIFLFLHLSLSASIPPPVTCSFFLLHHGISIVTATRPLLRSPFWLHSPTLFLCPSEEDLSAQCVAVLAMQLSGINRSFPLTE